jgi:hypothetical protein
MRGLRFMWKDESCANRDCPALYEVDGGHIVVGKLLSDDDLAQVRSLGEANSSGISADEIAVFLPTNVLGRLREKA